MAKLIELTQPDGSPALVNAYTGPQPLAVTETVAQVQARLQSARAGLARAQTRRESA